eukprot:TRINITY_DN11674_c0_g1_i1.p1 TRINITY_DN11674_c0_g1~~TRINITY_DN11674_c0_g1_i1.p1  ORF type:complete len:174 (-),score=42.49 TRINITY_DN11674_c0_g1_i1:18-539(-)
MSQETALPLFSSKSIPEEPKEVIQGFKKICEKQNKLKEAEIFENNIMKLVAKSKVLTDEKIILFKDFNPADDLLRKAFDLLFDLFDYHCDPIQVKAHMNQFHQVVKYFREAEELATCILNKHLLQKSIDRLKSMFDFLANIDFLVAVWLNPDNKDELFHLVHSLNKYTQFHYN